MVVGSLLFGVGKTSRMHILEFSSCMAEERSVAKDERRGEAAAS
jgi:hypothetical protein